MMIQTTPIDKITIRPLAFFNVPSKEQIENLQDELLKMPQADIVTLHNFLPGIYERTIIVPPWCVLTGAAHKTPYKVRLEQGIIAVNADKTVKILTAPYEFEANAGEQRVGRVFDEEVIWTDIYENPDNCTNIEELENRLYVIPECGLGENRKKLMNNNKNDILNIEGETLWQDM